MGRRAGPRAAAERAPARAPRGRARPTAAAPRRSRTTSIRGCGRRCGGAASSGSGRTRRGPGSSREPAATSASSRARRAARAWPTGCRCCSACWTIRTPARSTSSPTKALAQDQARGLFALGLGSDLRPALYDGDTAPAARSDARRRANLLLTNPDMLHVGICPHHDRWADVLANLTRSSSTRRTSIAASSARTSRTCCGGCAGPARSPARRRSSCWRRRRSRTRSRPCRR